MTALTITLTINFPAVLRELTRGRGCGFGQVFVVAGMERDESATVIFHLRARD